MVVLATIDQSGNVSQRFVKARPNAGSVHPVESYYDSSTGDIAPTNSRRSVLPTKSLVVAAGATGSPRSEWFDDSNSRTLTARDRVKAISAVSFSSNGKFLAVGETGYNPRAMVFLTSDEDQSNRPLSVMTEHSFGVRAVAFSPDSRYLATLGELNDGFLFIWTFDQKSGAVRLHSTNKCIAKVSSMAWCGSSLITVGVRHVKVWRVRVTDTVRNSPNKPHRRRLDGDAFASQTPQPLAGRNCLLGNLVDATFTCVTPISETEAVVCTEAGHVCIISGTGLSQEVKIAKKLPNSIGAVTACVKTGQVILDGPNGEPRLETIEQLRMLAAQSKWPSSGPQSPAIVNEPPTLGFSTTPAVPKQAREASASVAFACLDRIIIKLDEDCNLQMLCRPEDAGEELVLVNEYRSHRDPIQGVKLLSVGHRLGTFFTWSQSGIVAFWNEDGVLFSSRKIEAETTHDEIGEIPNELKIVDADNEARYFASGDKVGVLKVIDGNNWTVAHNVRAHSAEITSMSLRQEDNSCLIATSGRDRLVQLFKHSTHSKQESDQDPSASGGPSDLRTEIELLQSMNDHVGAVAQVLFVDDGKRLLSCSADRTIVIRDRVLKTQDFATLVAYFSTKVVTLKSSILSMVLIPNQSATLIAATMDRHLVTIDMSSGAQTESIKVSDDETDETAVMNCLAISQRTDEKDSRLLLAISSTDKSLRVYDNDRGILLAREYGHTERLTGLALQESEDSSTGETKRTVISTGLDGTIMIWNLNIRTTQPLHTPLQEISQSQALQIHDGNGLPSPLMRPPIRRVISKSDLADFTIFDPVTQTMTPVRDQSPPRIRRKTSRYSVVPTKLDLIDSPALPPAKRRATRGNSPAAETSRRSPSPGPAHPTKQRSLTSHAQQTSQDIHRTLSRSLSPAPIPQSLPNTPAKSQRANNARLRRPPSVPSDLRSQARLNDRRKSLAVDTSVSESQHLTRALRGYRKRLDGTEDQLQLEEVETELLATLQVVRERMSDGKAEMPHPPTESDLESLARLLEKTAVS